jgi:predicted  nucleic acid-binding Zn-ribbon protein
MEQLRSLHDLLDLQEVDLEIDRLLAERQSLPELAAYRTAHDRSVAIGGRKEAAEAELRATTLDLDKTSGELELAEQKLAAEQNRLYAGGLSARDADFMRREVQMLERKNGEMEDRILELMEERDRQEATVEELGEALAASDEEKAGFEAVIQEAWNGIDARLARKEARKADIIPLIDDELLELYDELRDLKEGVAVGRLADGVCGGCHLRLTAAEQLEVAKGDPPRCIHCRRILAL